MSAITDKHLDEEKHMGSQDYVESKDSRVEAAISAGNNLHRGLKNRHVAMISIGRLSLSFCPQANTQVVSSAPVSSWVLLMPSATVVPSVCCSATSSWVPSSGLS